MFPQRFRVGAPVALVFWLWLGLASGEPDRGASKGLSLSQAIDLAFAHNPDLTAATARIGEAEARVAEATAAFYPRLTARAEYTYTDNPAVGFSNIVAQRRFSPGFDINHPGWVANFRPEIVGSWNLYRGGQDAYLKRAAELGVEAAELERSTLRNRLAAVVTAAYYAVLSAPRQVDVAHRSVETVTREIEQAKARVAEGITLKAEVMSLEARAMEAYESELKARNAIELSLSALRTLLGGESFRIAEQEPESAAAAPGDFQKLLDQALTERPEIYAAAHQVEIRRQELAAAQGARLPRVNAYAGYGQNSRSLDFSLGRDNAILGLNAEMDLFSGGAVSARIEAAEHRLVEALAVEQRIRLEIEDELRRAHSTLSETLQRVKAAQAGAASAEEALRLVNEQYRGGTATVTRYLEAETDRADAALRAIVARYESRVAAAQLQKAVGYWR
ncbi:MAG: TolC family protein [Methylococcales bacterium]